MTTLRRPLAWVLALGLLALGCVTWLIDQRSPKAELVNVGSVALHDVLVRVSGESYAMGTLEPGATVQQRLEPRGDSHVELDWRTPDGRAHQADLGGYFSSGWPSWTGTVRVEIAGADVRRLQNNIRGGP